MPDLAPAMGKRRQISASANQARSKVCDSTVPSKFVTLWTDSQAMCWNSKKRPPRPLNSREPEHLEACAGPWAEVFSGMSMSMVFDIADRAR
ncbi:MAG: hypothetical protein P8H69_09010, partial [Planktomarina sp.]|nr:hypothetical protein [Planktomarina sp.]